MANIRVDINYTIQDGSEIVFRSPVDCSAVTGLIVYYQAEDGNTTSKVFALADAHGENVGDVPHLFAENVVVKVILDVTSGMAFVQNADTNAYLEGRFEELLPKTELNTAIDTALAQAKASGEFEGKKGDDGISPTVEVSKSGKVTTVSITDRDGTKTATINDGADGSAGKDGTSVTVKSVSESTADGGSNVVTFSDGKTVTIKNGSKGSDGVSATHSWSGTTLTVTSASGTSSANLKGEKGEKGDKGDSIKGDKGDTGVSVSSVNQTTTSDADGGSNVVTVTLSNGTTSTFTVKNGSKGSMGTNGKDGKTPVKGTDYFTAADKAEMVSAVIAALPDASEVSY